MKRYLFETKRLLFREIEADDLELLMRLNGDSRVMNYFPKVMSPEENKLFHQKIQVHQRQEGYSFWAVELKESQTFIGIIGLLKIEMVSSIKGEVEISWRLLSDFWGKGLATEGAQGVLDYGFHQLKLKQIYAFTAEINQPSEKVMKGLGMRKAGHFNHPKVAANSPLSPHVLYQLSTGN